VSTADGFWHQPSNVFSFCHLGKHLKSCSTRAKKTATYFIAKPHYEQRYWVNHSPVTAGVSVESWNWEHKHFLCPYLIACKLTFYFTRVHDYSMNKNRKKAMKAKRVRNQRTLHSFLFADSLLRGRSSSSLMCRNHSLQASWILFTDRFWDSEVITSHTWST